MSYEKVRMGIALLSYCCLDKTQILEPLCHRVGSTLTRSHTTVKPISCVLCASSTTRSSRIGRYS